MCVCVVCVCVCMCVRVCLCVLGQMFLFLFRSCLNNAAFVLVARSFVWICYVLFSVCVLCACSWLVSEDGRAGFSTVLSVMALMRGGVLWVLYWRPLAASCVRVRCHLFLFLLRCVPPLQVKPTELAVSSSSQS